MAEMNMPYAVDLKPTGLPEFSAVLTAVDEHFVYFKTMSVSTLSSREVQAAALASLEWVAIVEAKDSSDVSEWRKR